MKKPTYIVVGLIVATLVIGGSYYSEVNKNKTGEDESTTNQKVTYSKNEIGLQFDYRSGPTGYVLEERGPTDLGTGLVRTILLKTTANTLQAPPANSEGYPVINISVFEIAKKQSARFWADRNTQYSNINLRQGKISEAVVGGANAIRYMTDGLYSSEAVVVSSGDNIYVITGQFVDENSDIRKDFAPLLNSITFIPKSNQE